jgi:hypothetical protein
MQPGAWKYNDKAIPAVRIPNGPPGKPPLSQGKAPPKPTVQSACIPRDRARGG